MCVYISNIFQPVLISAKKKGNPRENYISPKRSQKKDHDAPKRMLFSTFLVVALYVAQLSGPPEANTQAVMLQAPL